MPDHMVTPVLEGVLSRITQEYERRLLRKENELLWMRDAVAVAQRGEQAALEALEDAAEAGEAGLAASAAAAVAAAVAAQADADAAAAAVAATPPPRRRAALPATSGGGSGGKEGGGSGSSGALAAATTPMSRSRSLRRGGSGTELSCAAAVSARRELATLRDALRSLRADAAAALHDAAHDAERLGALLPPLAARAARASLLAAENRALHSQLLDLKGAIRVVCRVRPLLPGEGGRAAVAALGPRDEGAPPCDVHVEEPARATPGGGTAPAASASASASASPSAGGGAASSDAPPLLRAFAYDRVFGPEAAQAEVFAEVAPLVRAVCDGYDACIFAYGQTGSGKTFTMAGPGSNTSLAARPEDARGVNYRALECLFELAAARAADVAYEFSVQMVEIYNENVRDLLAPQVACADGSLEAPRVEVRLAASLGGGGTSGGGGSGVPDAASVRVACAADVGAAVARGEAARAVGATALNERSSRSHAILIVTVAGAPVPPPLGDANAAAPPAPTGVTTRATLHLIDLAGSERVKSSEAAGERLREAQHINRSLSALGDVMAALQSSSRSHVPYRNSKLTSLLAAPLAGAGKALMLVHVSPAAAAVSESLSTLHFATRVAAVELGAARRNTDGGAAAAAAAAARDVAAAREEAARERRAGAAAAARCEELERALAAATGRGSSGGGGGRSGYDGAPSPGDAGFASPMYASTSVAALHARPQSAPFSPPKPPRPPSTGSGGLGSASASASPATPLFATSRAESASAAAAARVRAVRASSLSHTALTGRVAALTPLPPLRAEKSSPAALSPAALSTLRASTPSRGTSSGALRAPAARRGWV
jgi:kinesin family protein C2/C3